MIGNRPSVYAVFWGLSMVHQKAHKKRAGEAGGKARFEGWQGRAPAAGPACGVERRGSGRGWSARPGTGWQVAQLSYAPRRTRLAEIPLTDSSHVLHMFHIRRQMMQSIDDIREAVAKALEARGLDNRKFLGEIRAGQRDDGPYMIGALAVRVLTKVAPQ
jgi:hypothetical protein